MTEPENFDDELFADLYNDDEPSASRAPAAAPAQTAPPVVAPAAAQDPASNDSYGDDAGDQGVGDYDDSAMQYDDDDDEVDFNLGNGSSSNKNAGPGTNAGAGTGAGSGFGAGQHSEETPQPSGGGQFSGGPRPGPLANKVGPNSKEDGGGKLLVSVSDLDKKKGREIQPRFANGGAKESMEVFGGEALGGSF
ncbi:uncharacterized protein SPSK_05501 [Sporothrix schenckii 1099-18]|uniref:Uncharacterized protein n=1 Tax=Sporothrix schenckii 1099-18 TaxID=1397361 RepID=A0A0F2LUF5_SPOSC|nr:uncharacterized protein SPSK_05501 [Sporothrix schenckii 1099-18]KJR80464.1 hypothetical protein SPSK_05501 [Sporothrix schenckii 1099-18]